MFVEDFNGTEICNNMEELSKIMQRRDENGYNEFWISLDEEEQYPCIVVSVYQDLAYLHYFEDGGEPGWMSVMETSNGLDEEGMTRFYTNGGTEEIMVENGAIVTVDQALNAVAEFSDTEEMPDCIGWEEL